MLDGAVPVPKLGRWSSPRLPDASSSLTVRGREISRGNEVVVVRYQYHRTPAHPVHDLRCLSFLDFIVQPEPHVGSVIPYSFVLHTIPNLMSSTIEFTFLSTTPAPSPHLVGGGCALPPRHTFLCTSPFATLPLADFPRYVRGYTGLLFRSSPKLSLAGHRRERLAGEVDDAGQKFYVLVSWEVRMAALRMASGRKLTKRFASAFRLCHQLRKRWGPIPRRFSYSPKLEYQLHALGPRRRHRYMQAA
ncbi:hypothetical protein R3P38DRAFT_3214354 [Favolaschia claudopus]|uniref:Uncharacterized protein n=1 Tax=Favolaschia claudopus TaxID=2862362 RepID=A0AAW0AAW7_9AGAR